MKKLHYVVGILAIVFLFSQCKKYEIGDLQEIGIVFYVDESGKHGLVCQTADLPGFYTWDEAIEACNDLGNGWYLPTKDELNLLYTNLHQNGLGGFDNGDYWSSTENFSLNAWKQVFGDGSQFSNLKVSYLHVRAVRAF